MREAFLAMLTMAPLVLGPMVFAPNSTPASENQLCRDVGRDAADSERARSLHGNDVPSVGCPIK